MPAWLTPWLSAGAFLGAIVTAVMTGIGWRKQRELADRQAGHQRELAERQAERATFATRELENVKSELTGQLEGVRTELSVLARLRTTAEEKRAQVAADGLVSCLAFLEALRRATSPFALKGDPDEREGQPLYEARQSLYQARWERFKPSDQEFQAAWVQVEVYLADEVQALMENVSKLRQQIQTAQLTHVMLLRGDERDQIADYWYSGFGPKPEKLIDILRAEVKAVLRPLARLDQTKERA